MRSTVIPFLLVVLLASSAAAQGEELPSFSSPEARIAWHVKRAKTFKKRRAYLDAYTEYATLVANGGGDAKVEKEIGKLRKKAGISEDEAATLRASIKPAGPSAHPLATYESGHYDLETNADKVIAEEWLHRLEGLYAAFQQIYGKPLGAHRAKNLKARIFRTREDYDAYLGEEQPADQLGFYSQQKKTFFSYCNFENEAATQKTWDTLCHEGTHQLFCLVCNQDANVTKLSHFWVIEGVAIYMEGLEWDGASYEMTGIAEYRLAEYRQMVKSGTTIPLDEYFALDQRGAQTSRFYAQAAVIAAYLMHDEDLRKPFLKYIKWCIGTRSRKKVEAKTFGEPLPTLVCGINDWVSDSLPE